MSDYFKERDEPHVPAWLSLIGGTAAGLVVYMAIRWIGETLIAWWHHGRIAGLVASADAYERGNRSADAGYSGD